MPRIQTLLIAYKSKPFSAALADAAGREYRVRVCYTGVEALRLIDQLRPDLLVLDLTLPQMDGISVLKNAGHKPPVILGVTNIVSDRIIGEASAAGVQDLLLIPCKTEHVMAHLNKLLQQRNAPLRP